MDDLIYKVVNRDVSMAFICELIVAVQLLLGVLYLLWCMLFPAEDGKREWEGI